MEPFASFDMSDSSRGGAAKGIAHGVLISLVAWLAFANLWLLMH